MSGPIPVSSSSNSPSGTFTRLKKGGPTVIFTPRTASERIGKSVPQSTENAMPTSARLLKRNAASRLAIDSSCASGSSLRPAHVEQGEGRGGRHHQEAEEEEPDVRLREAVHARDDARAGDERAENGEQERAR